MVIKNKQVLKTLAFKEVIFVTGGAGFIGSNFLNRIVPRYPNSLFVNIDALTSVADLSNVEVSLAPNYCFEKADIRDKNVLEKLFKKYEPNSIIHFAAESHVDVSIKNPSIFIETNIIGTHNLLMCARDYKLARFHHISTDEVYGSLETREGKFNETSQLAPNSPYSASKAGAECLARAYHKTFGLNVVITRSSNTYGPRQDRTKLIPLFISKLLLGQKVPLYSIGKNVRDWLYIDDHIDALDLVFRNGRVGEVYNIGGDCEMTNIEVTKKILALLKYNDDMIEYVADRPGHDFRYALSSEKIALEFGWKPKVSFEKGLTETVKFYKNNK